MLCNRNKINDMVSRQNQTLSSPSASLKPQLQLRQYASSSGYCGLPTIRERKTIRRKLLLLLRNLRKARRSAGLTESTVEKEGNAREEGSALEAGVYEGDDTSVIHSRLYVTLTFQRSLRLSSLP